MTGYVLGVAGTAKNTGKTTVLRLLLGEAAAAGLPVALTSIGYDGEDLDHVTGLPKPRLAVPVGTWLATAEPAVRGRPWLEVAETTAVETAVGRVVLARAARPGRVVLAGPATAADLGRILDRLRRLGARLVLVDGAFGRLAPMTAADGLVLATGAARHRDPAAVSREAAAIASLFRLPVRPCAGAGPDVVRVRGGGGTATLPYPALLADDWADAVAAAVAGVSGERAVHLPGSVNVGALMRLGQRLAGDVTVVFSHPLHLLASGEPEAVAAAVAALAGRGIGVMVERTLPLLGFTVNPCYPVRAGGKYRARHVDAAALLKAMRAVVPLPVTDVFHEGPRIVWTQLRQAAPHLHGGEEESSVVDRRGRP